MLALKKGGKNGDAVGPGSAERVAPDSGVTEQTRTALQIFNRPR